MKEAIGHWIAAAFSAVICAFALARWATSEAGAVSPAFFAFLPMCFVFMGLATFRLQREIGELQRRLHELEARRR